MPSLFMLVLAVTAFYVHCSTISLHLQQSIIQHHLRVHQTRAVLFFSCNRRTEVQLLRSAHYMNVFTSVLNIRHRLDDYVQQYFGQPYDRYGIVLDLECSPADRLDAVLSAASQQRLFGRRFVWLLFARDVRHVEGLLSVVNLNVDADITAVTMRTMKGDAAEAGDEVCDLWDVYNPSSARGGRLNITHLQVWRDTVQTQLIASTACRRQRLYERQRDLGGITFNGLLVIANLPANRSLQTHLDTVDLVHLDTGSRLNYHLFRIIQDMHNIRIRLLRITRHFGWQQRNGTWSGAIAHLIHANDDGNALDNNTAVDICLSPIRWSQQQIALYDSTASTYEQRVRFVFRHPRAALAAQRNIFMQPFTNAVWLAIVAFGVLGAVSIRQMLVLEWRMIPDAATQTYWSSSLLMMLGILCQQGYYDAEPRLMAARILTLTILFLALMLLQFYAAFVVGSLLMEAPKTIGTAKQLLLDSHRLQCGVDEEPRFIDVFNRSASSSDVDPVAQRMYKHWIVQKRQVYEAHRGIELVRQGGFAFYTDWSGKYTQLMDDMSDAERCELQEVHYEVSNVAGGPALPKHSPLQEMIRIDIRRLTESGVLSYHSAIWEQRKPKCATTENDGATTVEPLDLVHFAFAAYVLAVGAALSAICLAGELLVASWRLNGGRWNLVAFWRATRV